MLQVSRPGRLRFAIACVLALAGLFAEGAQAQSRSSPLLEEIKKTKVLRVGWGVYFPYMYRDPGTHQVTGITVDLFNEIAKRLDAKAEFVEETWATMVAGLGANKFDLTMPIAATPQRSEVVTFTRPIVHSSISLMVPAKEAAKDQSWKGVDKPGLKITTTLGSSMQTAITPQLQHAELVLVKAAPDSLTQVMTGCVNAWANSYEALLYVRKEHPELEIVPGPPIGYDEIAIAVRKGDVGTQQWLDGVLDDLRKNGVLRSIIEKNGLSSTFMAE